MFHRRIIAQPEILVITINVLSGFLLQGYERFHHRYQSLDQTHHYSYFDHILSLALQETQELHRGSHDMHFHPILIETITYPERYRNMLSDFQLILHDYDVFFKACKICFSIICLIIVIFRINIIGY